MQVVSTYYPVKGATGPGSRNRLPPLRSADGIGVGANGTSLRTCSPGIGAPPDRATLRFFVRGRLNDLGAHVVSGTKGVQAYTGRAPREGEAHSLTGRCMCLDKLHPTMSPVQGQAWACKRWAGSDEQTFTPRAGGYLPANYRGVVPLCPSLRTSPMSRPR